MVAADETEGAGEGVSRAGVSTTAGVETVPFKILALARARWLRRAGMTIAETTPITGIERAHPRKTFSPDPIRYFGRSFMGFLYKLKSCRFLSTLSRMMKSTMTHSAPRQAPNSTLAIAMKMS